MMLIERVVINASPLIILFRGHLESLLPGLFSEIYVPGAVWSEVTGGGYRDESASGIINAGWAKRVKVSGISPSVAAWDLGIGESEVLSFALGRPGFRAMVDDKAARRCAKTLGIRTLGTGGMLVLAKRRGLIESVSDALATLRTVGLWMSDELVDLFLEEAGEK
jgi:predicted nucleic acid-binding protein